MFFLFPISYVGMRSTVLFQFFVSQQMLWVPEQNNAADSARAHNVSEKVMHPILKQATLSMCQQGHAV